MLYTYKTRIADQLIPFVYNVRFFSASILAYILYFRFSHETQWYQIFHKVVQKQFAFTGMFNNDFINILLLSVTAVFLSKIGPIICKVMGRSRSIVAHFDTHYVIAGFMLLCSYVPIPVIFEVSVPAGVT